MVETTTDDAMASINFKNDWIVDSGCGHHLTSDCSKFSKFCHSEGKDDIVMTDNIVHHV